MKPVVRKIVSGGQTGADRAGLDFAIAYGVEYGGWVPLGGIAEDMKTPPGLLTHYPLLQEASTTSMAARTKMNVRDSDATLIIRVNRGPLSPGTRLTIDLCTQLKKPCAVVDPNDWDGAEQIGNFILQTAYTLNNSSTPTPLVLNVAGPRESKSRGIYDAAIGLLIESMGEITYIAS